ncbi:alpha/beta hydrolase family protein [Nitrincola sp. MINF-07-Sa-05]|uniref:alpha/beta hydrolase family protein n=1 Tax=Nitrincola salilacus TaxID=3400273 RepID=UPI0039181719
MKTTSLTAAEAVASTVEYGSVQAHAGLVFWIAYDPGSGCNRLHCLDVLRESMTCLTPEGMSVRSRVHEYGGGAWSIAGMTTSLLDGGSRSDVVSNVERVAWVNDRDQQIWLTRLSSSSDNRIQPLAAPSSYRLTSQANMRFADLTYDPIRHRLLAVAEIHQEGESAQGEEVCNLLVAICLESGKVSAVARGADFYAAPALSPDGRWLAWVEWHHPAQPWLNTRIRLCDLDHPELEAAVMGSMGRASTESSSIEGRSTGRSPTDDQVAWLQPRFSPDAELLAVGDVDNWWNLFKLSRDSAPEPLADTVQAEFTQAPWQLGLCSYGWSHQGELLAIAQAEGYSTLRRYQADHKRWLTVPLPFTRLHSLALAGDHAYMVAECPERSSGIIMLDLSNNQWRYLCGGAEPNCYLSLPQARSCPLDNGDELPFFYYPPQTSRLTSDNAPPLIMLIHGGPTSSTVPVLNPRIQYWTQRGFAVADLNYRGSCGYGRRYRMMLESNWGIADVEDAERVADWLVSQGLADAKALFIRGQSAGGYTVLMALLSSQRWCAGASLYGISDLQRLAQTTHKFESRYLNWLIGDPDNQGLDNQELFRQRSPYYLADGWKTPVIFFQGGKDRVVPPEQTLRLQERLQQAGVRVEACLFDDEGHGFRLARNQQQVLEQEMAFYLGSLEVAKGRSEGQSSDKNDTKVQAAVD